MKHTNLRELNNLDFLLRDLKRIKASPRKDVYRVQMSAYYRDQDNGVDIRDSVIIEAFFDFIDTQIADVTKRIEALGVTDIVA